MRVSNRAIEQKILSLVRERPGITVLEARRYMRESFWRSESGQTAMDGIVPGKEHESREEHTIRVLQTLVRRNQLMVHTYNSDFIDRLDNEALPLSDFNSHYRQKLQYNSGGNEVADDKLQKNKISPEGVSSTGKKPTPQKNASSVTIRVLLAYQTELEKLRQGQQLFRQQLLEEHNGVCMVTGCDVEECLEAAHICQFVKCSDGGFHISNGLLLRSDIHTLFDSGLLWFEPNGGSWTVKISSRLARTEYSQFNDKILPDNAMKSKDRQALDKRFEEAKDQQAKDSEVPGMVDLHIGQSLTLTLI